MPDPPPPPACITRPPPPSPLGTTEVTRHSAVGSPGAATIVEHSASCLAWPNDSTVSSAIPSVMDTTSIRTTGGGGADAGGDEG
jgi:hypothetical protein